MNVVCCTALVFACCRDLSIVHYYPHAIRQGAESVTQLLELPLRSSCQLLYSACLETGYSSDSMFAAALQEVKPL